MSDSTWTTAYGCKFMIVDNFLFDANDVSYVFNCKDDTRVNFKSGAWHNFEDKENKIYNRICKGLTGEAGNGNA